MAHAHADRREVGVCDATALRCQCHRQPWSQLGMTVIGCSRNFTKLGLLGEGCYFLVFVQLFEKYGTLIERNTGLIEKVSPCRCAATPQLTGHTLTVNGEGDSSTAAIELVIVEQHGVQLGSSLWHSALPLCRHLAQNTQLFCNKKVIELGAGVGACGITCALAGAKSVVLTDKPNVCQHSEQNVAANSFRPNVDITVKPLVWGASLDAATIAACPFDLIVASECVYQPVLLQLLVKTIHRLSAAGTTVVLSFCQRGGIILSEARSTIAQGFPQILGWSSICWATIPIQDKMVCTTPQEKAMAREHAGVSDTRCAYIVTVRKVE
eukprot:SAG31_NODE_349_length_17243_cov_7.408248_4_plen_324_part_00